MGQVSTWASSLLSAIPRSSSKSSLLSAIVFMQVVFSLEVPVSLTTRF